MYMMKKWIVVIILACAMFVMILDSTVMNVSIAKVVEDLHTTVSGLQMAITFYALTMAALMLIGGKLGTKWGRLKAFRVGIIIFGVGALITSLSPNILVLTIGWSFIEGLGGVLVIPAISALVATNYTGRARVTGYAIIGGISGAAAAAGPLIGGFVTTYFSWRYIFFSEVFLMAIVFAFSYKIADIAPTVAEKAEKIDVKSALLSSIGMFILVFGILQSKVWGWVIPHEEPILFGHPIAPLGISLVPYFIIAGIIILRFFWVRQQKLEKLNLNPLMKPSFFKSAQLRSGLSVWTAQYLILAALFFALPVYLQMTLDYDAFDTGIKILPLSIAVIVSAIAGSRLVKCFSPRSIVRAGQLIIVAGMLLLMGTVSLTLDNVLFGLGMAFVGIGLGLLASQLANINMSTVKQNETSEIGGLQGVAQNLGSTLGTAIVGSILIASLTGTFVSNINSSNLPDNVKNEVQQTQKIGIPIVSASQVNEYVQKSGVSSNEAQQITQIYSDSQITALRESLFVISIFGIASLFFTGSIPNKKIIN